MKRHPHLQPLSREHHLGLVISNKAKSCTENDISEHWQALKAYLTTQVPKHFAIESEFIASRLLQIDGTQELAKQMLNEHEYIENLLTIQNPTIDDVKALADALYNHIRFEERILFNLAQENLSNDELQAIYNACADNVK